MIKKLLLALVPLLVLLLLTEGLLWMFDIGGGELHLSRGFDASVRYLVPDPDVPGGWQTQLRGADVGRQAELFDRRKPELSIPPKGERKRLVMVGGSNVDGFPGTHLERALNEADPTPGWEVLNLGRAGYGSGRVVIIVEQAAAVLDPDVVVIYSGHNEFIERTFAEELEKQWSSPLARSAAETLAHLRLFNVVSGALSTPDAAGAPEPIERLGSERNALTWEDTGPFYENYRSNLVRMCEASQDAGAEVLLCTLISNMLYEPIVATPGSELSPDDVRKLASLVNRAVVLVPERVRVGMLDGPRVGLAEWYDSIWTGDEQQDVEVPSLRPLPGVLAVAPATKGKAPSVEGAHWPEPRGWTDRVVETVRAVDAFHVRDLTDEERAQLQEAAGLADRALEIEATNPKALYTRGVIAWLLGEDDAAALALLDEARRYDRAPKAANALVNETVRAVAAEQDVTLFDASALWRGRMPDGLVGYEVMMDACHLQPGARYILMEDFAEQVRALDVSR